MDLETIQDPDFLQFTVNVKELTGIDLSLYKEQQMKRRLSTLRLKYGYTTFASFFEEIKNNREVLDTFLDRITINVSEFWRNPARWEVLEHKLIPEMLAGKKGLKCWSAACSTGEEPYTLAMILAELGVLTYSKIWATDLDDGALDKAQEAIYQNQATRDVPEKYKSKYLVEHDQGVTVSQELRQAITFQKQNLLKDRFATGFDLIICRNVLIYFTNEAKHLLYQKFSDALTPGGILFVGSTEQIFSPAQYDLKSVDTFFYKKHEGGS